RHQLRVIFEEALLGELGLGEGALRMQVINVQLQIFVDFGEQQTQDRTTPRVPILDIEQPFEVRLVKAQILVGRSERFNDLVQRECLLINVRVKQPLHSRQYAIRLTAKHSAQQHHVQPARQCKALIVQLVDIVDAQIQRLVLEGLPVQIKSQGDDGILCSQRMVIQPEKAQQFEGCNNTGSDIG